MASKKRIPSAPLRVSPASHGSRTKANYGADILAVSWPLFLTLTTLLLLVTRPKCDVAGAPVKTEQPQDCPLHWDLRVRIDGAGPEANRIVTLRLDESSKDFLHSSERSGSSGGIVDSGGRQLEPAPLPPCFYQGGVEGGEGLAVAKQRDGWISGSFHFGGRAFEIPEQPAQSAVPLSAHRMPPSTEKRTCGVSTEQSAVASVPVDPETLKQHQAAHERHPRALKLDTHSAYTAAPRKYIQLILIGDQSFFEKQAKDMLRAKDRLWHIGNYVNAFYKQLGVNVITVYTETWQTDPYNLTSANNPAGVNTTELLRQFMRYRMRMLSFKTHTAAHLVSGLKFSAALGDLGLAYIGQLCTFDQSGGVNSDTKADVGVIATTVAHELGHNLGLNHDEEEKNCGTCPDPQGCVMAATGANVNPVRFSKCSISRFTEFSVSNGVGYCMSDPPLDSAVAGARATCGNGIVEAGEDCDCGPSASSCGAAAKCCNPSKCRFNPRAKCASGECCNRDTCTLMSQGTVCRSSRGRCDLPEYCSGTSEWCPQFDDYKVDGTECLTGKAYCYKGQCNDRDSRCVAIFGGSGVKAAPADWSVATTQGERSGYCSYNESSVNPLAYEYKACSAENQRCGLLYCVGGSLSSDTPTSNWTGLDSAELRRLSASIGGINIDGAGYAMHNLKYSGYRDPGMVPNGAECGANMMCVDSQCVPATPSVTCPNCNNRGYCTQSSLCFCTIGFKPPDCLKAGGGGSVTNRLPDGNSNTKADNPGAAQSAGGSISWWLLSVAQLSLLLLLGFIANGHCL